MVGFWSSKRIALWENDDRDKRHVRSILGVLPIATLGHCARCDNTMMSRSGAMPIAPAQSIVSPPKTSLCCHRRRAGWRVASGAPVSGVQPVLQLPESLIPRPAFGREAVLSSCAGGRSGDPLAKAPQSPDPFCLTRPSWRVYSRQWRSRTYIVPPGLLAPICTWQESTNAPRPGTNTRERHLPAGEHGDDARRWQVPGVGAAPQWREPGGQGHGPTGYARRAVGTF